MQTINYTESGGYHIYCSNYQNTIKLYLTTGNDSGRVVLKFNAPECNVISNQLISHNTLAQPFSSIPENQVVSFTFEVECVDNTGTFGQVIADVIDSNEIHSRKKERIINIDC